MKYEQKTYQHTEHCRNCGHPNLVSIPKGVTISTHLKSVSCSNCGVALRQPEYRYRERDEWMLVEETRRGV